MSMWLLEEEIKEQEQKKSPKFPTSTAAEEDLRTLMLNVIEKYRRYIFPDAYKIIKNKLLFSGDIRFMNKQMGRENSTAAVYPLTESIVDTFVANLYDSVSIPKVSARHKEDEVNKEMAQDFCDRAYDISDAWWAKQLIRWEAALLGTSYGMAWWEERTQTSRYATTSDWEKTFTNKISNPTLDHVPFFELFCDLSTSDFYAARWKARRKILSLSEIKKRYSSLIEFTKDIEEKIKVTMWNEVSKYDFTKIYDIKNYENYYNNTNYSSWNSTWELSFFEDNVLLSITDKNPLVELIEYREEDKLVIMINGYIYYDGYSPYPFGDPFAIVVYERMPGTFLGRGIGQKISTLQQQATSIYCKIRDAINQHIAPMYSVVKGMLSKDQTGQTVQSITYVPGKVVQTESPDIKNGGITPIDFVNYQMVQIARDELASVVARAQEIVGTNSYVQWGQWKVERSGIAANLKVWVTKTRLKPIESSMERFDWFVFQQRLALASLSENTTLTVKVLWDEWYRYSEVTPSDLLNKFDITVDIEGMIEQTRLQKVNETIQLLTAIAPYNINPISQTPNFNPDALTKYIWENTGNSALKAMTFEEREAYAEEHIKLAAKLKQATADQTTPAPYWAQPTLPPVPDMNAWQPPQIDPNTLQGFYDQNANAS